MGNLTASPHMEGASSPMPSTTFESMYRKYLRPIYNYVYMRLLNREAAEDVTQDVFLAALTAMDRFDSSQGEGMAWLLKITERKIMDWRKKAYVRRETSVDAQGWIGADGAAGRGVLPSAEFTEEHEPMIASEAEGTISNPINRRAYRILEQLTEKERELLALRYELGLTNEEIAKRMDSNAPAVCQRFSRLLKKCRRIDATEGAAQNSSEK